MPLTPKENYLRMMNGEIPEFVPAGMILPHGNFPVPEELLTPASAPNGPIVTSLGVTYVGSEENNWGAMPKPGEIIIDDITKWRDQLKIRDVSDMDWEAYYKEKNEKYNRELCVSIGGGDYFLTLVSLMGFEGALLAMYEETDEVIDLLTHISEFYLTVFKNQLHYLKPDVFGLMDDDSAYRAPFFSVEMYRKIFKPFHKMHTDLALEAGCVIDRHDCGKSEGFIDDWLEIGIRSWGPNQDTNDMVAVKKKYGNRLAIGGNWNSKPFIGKKAEEQELRDVLAEYVDTFAPGGGFMYTVMLGGMPGMPPDPIAEHNREIANKFYHDYVKDWYKTH
ncbi:MAG: hypothetical protein FWG48_02175 [Oscillospiraceae bacterium]|nr:hypothetical protein [Oscillospiraceae bacterium]